MEIYYNGKKPWHGTLTFYVAAEKQGNFIVSSEKESISATVTSVPTQIRLPLDLYPDSRVNVSFVGIWVE